MLAPAHTERRCKISILIQLADAVALGQDGAGFFAQAGGAGNVIVQQGALQLVQQTSLYLILMELLKIMFNYLKLMLILVLIQILMTMILMILTMMMMKMMMMKKKIILKLIYLM